MPQDTSDDRGRPDAGRPPRQLGRLRLSADDLAALAEQGFVAPEVRASGRCRYKLRFRRDGRQHVRCLGSDPAVADEVRRALAVLQAPRRNERKLARLTRVARRQLRKAKRILEPTLLARGFVFHGHEIRRPRTRVSAAAAPTPRTHPARRWRRTVLETLEESPAGGEPNATCDLPLNPGEKPPADPERLNARLARIEDYEADVLEREDPLEANLGAMSSGLMRIGAQLTECIERSLASGPSTLDWSQKVLPAVETQLRIARQVDRFAHLEMKLQAPSSADQTAKPR